MTAIQYKGKIWEDVKKTILWEIVDSYGFITNC